MSHVSSAPVCVPEPDTRLTSEPLSLNCISVDVEEYFHAEVFHGCLHPGDWPDMERRAEPCLERIAELLDQADSRATFFVLGALVGELAPLLRRLACSGHEIACHGEHHQHLSRLGPQELREDLRTARKKLEDALGVRPRGYRAPTFSITHETAWALDVVAQEGFEYDASIFPVRHDRYGVPAAPSQPFWAVTPSGVRLLEFPPLTAGWGPLRVPIGGGGYLRLLPGSLVNRCLTARERNGKPVMIYVHPWELDPDQPRLPVGRFSQWRHRVNLRKTDGKLKQLLNRHRFDTAGNILQHVRANNTLPTYTFTKQQTSDQA